MNSLQQRLKEMSKEDFESLMDQLLQSKYPTAGITRVDGTGGDEGIDNFQGLLSDGPSVWQDKHFPNRIQKTQRKQILKAIKAAFDGRTPRRWVLCVPINLRTTEHNWFQNEVKAVYEKNYPGTKIELMQASHIIHDLMHFKTVREAFFPDAVSDVARLKQLVMGSENLTKSQRAEVTKEYAEQYLASLKELDPRCDFEVTIGGNSGARLGRVPGLMLTIQERDMVTRVFARDSEAIRLAPPGCRVTMLPAAANKIQVALDTGRPQVLLPGEVVSIDPHWRLLEPLKGNASGMQIDITPVVPQPDALIPLRLKFGTGEDVREIRYLPFKKEYVGQREITLKSAGKLPLDVELVFTQEPKGALVKFSTSFAGAKFTDVNQVVQCIEALNRAPHLEVYSVELERIICSAKFFEIDRFDEGLRSLVADADLVARHFGAELRLPDELQTEDVENLRLLKRIATSEDFSINSLSASLVKDHALQEAALVALSGEPQLLRIEQQMKNPILFGIPIEIGLVVLDCEGVTVCNPDETRERYLAAANGQPVRIEWNCSGKCRFSQGNINRVF